MVDFLVGPDQEIFRVHKKLFLAKVPYFENKFSPASGDLVYETKALPADDPAAFYLLVQYTYDLKLHGYDVGSWENIALYSLAAKYDVYDLCNSLMDALILCHKRSQRLLMTPKYVRWTVEQQTTLDSKLVDYCIHMIHHIVFRKAYVMEGEQICSRFFSWWPPGEIAKLKEDLKHIPSFAARYTELESPYVTGDPREFPRCYFHVHPEGEKCGLGYKS
jgi:hypothetical protein